MYDTAYRSQGQRTLAQPGDVCAVRPAPTATQHMDDPAQRPAIIDTLLVAHVGRQQWRDAFPLRIIRPARQ